MKKSQPYLFILIALCRKLFRLGYGQLREIMLPGRNRKGTILSGIYRLFVGCAEELIQFREELLAIPLPVRPPKGSGRGWSAMQLRGSERLQDAWRYSKGYIRRGLIITAWGLFILSSLEWSGVRSPERETPVVRQEASYAARSARKDEARFITGKETAWNVHYPNDVFAAFDSPSTPIPRWLLQGNLRV